MILAKDFIETTEGLIFAVVENGVEQGKVLCFLRYIKSNSRWQKVNTEQANAVLAKKSPHYLFYSSIKQTHCHAVSVDNISIHYQPRVRLKKLLSAKAKDDVENDLAILCNFLLEKGLKLNDMGITGSILISAQNRNSDIDLVFYSRKVFNQARGLVQELIRQGKCSDLTENDWRESYYRRSCELSYDDYVWHEQRKFNKAVINQRKFDLSLVIETEEITSSVHYKKLNPIVLKVQVTDASLAFDYPAEFLIKHPQINSIVCYTATYTGQAETDEWVEVSGLLEQANDGIKRIIVGSSREAHGEYIKVISEKSS
jgi:predicted nucleotidyltransferase